MLSKYQTDRRRMLQQLLLLLPYLLQAVCFNFLGRFATHGVRCGILLTDNRITDRSFQYASHRLWNQISASLRQSRTYLSNSDSPNRLSGTSFIGTIDSPLSSSITRSHFHFRLKTSIFCKSFPP